MLLSLAKRDTGDKMPACMSTSGRGRSGCLVRLAVFGLPLAPLSPDHPLISSCMVILIPDHLVILVPDLSVNLVPDYRFVLAGDPPLVSAHHSRTQHQFAPAGWRHNDLGTLTKSSTQSKLRVLFCSATVTDQSL